MNEEQARERAEVLAKGRTRYLRGDIQTVAQQLYYEGYMAAWRDAQ